MVYGEQGIILRFDLFQMIDQRRGNGRAQNLVLNTFRSTKFRGEELSIAMQPTDCLVGKLLAADVGGGGSLALVPAPACVLSFVSRFKATRLLNARKNSPSRAAGKYPGQKTHPVCTRNTHD